MHDLIIVGGGPAGLTAAIYAVRRRLDVVLISPDLGGKTNQQLQLRDISHHMVVNGAEVVSRFASEIRYLDFVRASDVVERVEPLADGGYRLSTGSGRAYEARALIVATGANPRRLQVPGEAEYRLRGVVYSAVSYASLFVGGATVVVGDSDLALRSTAELARCCRQVTLVAANGVDLGSPLGQFLTEQTNVIVLKGYAVERITGDGYANGLVVSKNGDRQSLPADAVFVELGLSPNTGAVAGLVACDAAGHIVVDERNRTSAPGIFAAGDVTDVHTEQVLVAVGEGVKAALSAHEYLLAHRVARTELERAEDWR